MSYGLEIDGFAFTYGVFSVIQKGAVTSTFTFTKSDHPDVTDYEVAFNPIGVRDIANLEVRPTYTETNASITINKPANMSNHNYIILGR